MDGVRVLLKTPSPLWERVGVRVTATVFPLTSILSPSGLP